MIATHHAQHMNCSQRLCQRFLSIPTRRGLVCHAANCGTAAGACDPGIVTALQRYGDHSKAAYALYSPSCDNKLEPIDIRGKDLCTVAEGGGKYGPFPGLEGYTGVASIMGYPGRASVLTVPTPIRGDGVMALAALAPSFIGYIAEGPGRPTCWALLLPKAYMTTATARVHRGFHNLIHGTPDDADEDISPVKTIRAVLALYKDLPADKLPKIVTTGHSLGGALAILTAVYTAHYIPGYRKDSADYTLRKLHTYTFAAPRVGDRKLADYLGSTLKYNAVQVKNKPDVVPYTPPAGLTDMFRAVKKLIGMRPRRQRVAGKVTPAAADGAELEDMERWEAYKKLLGPLQDEDPDEQVKRLEQYIAANDTPGGAVFTTSSDNMVEYAKKLLSTKWSNNPAPCNGVCTLDVHKNDGWGQSHSLEVYLNNLKEGTNSSE